MSDVEVRPFYTADGITLFHGDSAAVLPTLPAESVDAVVTDPPAGIAFMGKEWDTFGGKDASATAAACLGESLCCLGVERELAYLEIAKGRLRPGQIFSSPELS